MSDNLKDRLASGFAACIVGIPYCFLVFWVSTFHGEYQDEVFSVGLFLGLFSCHFRDKEA